MCYHVCCRTPDRFGHRLRWGCNTCGKVKLCEALNYTETFLFNANGRSWFSIWRFTSFHCWTIWGMHSSFVLFFYFINHEVWVPSGRLLVIYVEYREMIISVGSTIRFGRFYGFFSYGHFPSYNFLKVTCPSIWHRSLMTAKFVFSCSCDFLFFK